MLYFGHPSELTSPESLARHVYINVYILLNKHIAASLLADSSSKVDRANVLLGSLVTRQVTFLPGESGHERPLGTPGPVEPYTEAYLPPFPTNVALI